MGNKHSNTHSPPKHDTSRDEPSPIASGAENVNASDGLASAFSQSLVHINGENIEIGKYYDGIRSQPIGKGGTSTVRVVTHKETKKRYACKTIRLLRVPPHKKMQLMREIEIIRSLDHPNVIKVIEIFKQWDQLHIVMELLSGGELFDRLEAQPGCRFQEEYIKKLSVKMIRAIHYLHSNGIIHRDLKLENFIFEDNSPDADLKLIDFGYSRTYLEGVNMTSVVGTSFYIAPEVVEGKYGKAADLWSLGCIVYMLATGELPIPGDDDAEILRNVKNLKASGRIKKFGDIARKVPGVKISDGLVDFINKLMHVGVSSRLTTQEALKHPWIVGGKVASSTSALSEIDASSVSQKIKKFKNYPDLKRAALMATAFYMDDKGMQKLKEEFMAIDTDGNGVLSFEEFSKALANHVDSKELYEIFHTVDQDQTNKIKYSEFLAACIDEKEFMKQEQLMATFRALDTDGDGKITKKELMAMLGDHISEEDVNKAIAQADFFKDGEIDLDEFIRSMQGERVV